MALSITPVSIFVMLKFYKSLKEHLSAPMTNAVSAVDRTDANRLKLGNAQVHVLHSHHFHPAPSRLVEIDLKA